MREILFKGKRIDNGEWVEGDLVRSYLKIGNVCITDFAKGIVYGVDNDTICQYTGLTDNNGNKIWENDICIYVEEDGEEIKEEKFAVKFGRFAEMCKINMGFYADWITTNYYRGDLVFWTENRNIKVIGNIFDNPELLKGE